MKRHYLSFLFGLFIAIIFAGNINAQEIAKRDTIAPEEVTSQIIGDINRDGIIDTAFVYTPALIGTFYSENDTIPYFGDCVDGHCFNKVTFSCVAPAFSIENSINGEVQNAGNLSGGKYNEILFQPNWFQGCWSHIYLMQYKNGKWIEIASVSVYACDLENTKNRIKKIKNNYYLLGEKWDIKSQNIKEYKRRLIFR